MVFSYQWFNARLQYLQCISSLALSHRYIDQIMTAVSSLITHRSSLFSEAPHSHRISSKMISSSLSYYFSLFSELFLLSTMAGAANKTTTLFSMRVLRRSWEVRVEKIFTYRQVSNIRRTLVGNKIVDHSDVVGVKTTSRRDETHLSSVIWCVLY